MQRTEKTFHYVSNEYNFDVDRVPTRADKIIILVSACLMHIKAPFMTNNPPKYLHQFATAE